MMIQQRKTKYYDKTQFRFIFALIATVLIHSFLLFFSTRNTPTQTQPESQSNNYIISPMTLARNASLLTTIKYKSSSYILTPDMKNGFSALAFIPQKRFQFHQNEYLTQEEDIIKKNNLLIQKQYLEKLTTNQLLSSIAFIGRFQSLDTVKKVNSKPIEYPVVFDCYGNKYDDLSELLKKMIPHKKNSFTKILFKKRSPDALPIFEIVRNSSDQELDLKAALIISQSLLKMRTFPENETIITINWGE